MKTVHHRERSRGFTIIELLVVVSIIGLISSTILANVTTTRQRAIQASALQFEASLRHSIGDKLVGSWNFNEGSGNTAYDDSGNSANGTISAGAAYATPGFTTTDPSAIYFSGSNSYVSGAGLLPTGDGTPVTVSAWVKPDVSSNDRAIFMEGSGSCKSFGVGISSAHLSIFNNTAYSTMIGPGVQQNAMLQNNNSSLAAAAKAVEGNNGSNDTPPSGSGGTIIPNSQWTNVVTIFDNGKVTTYVNGKMAGTATNIPPTYCDSSGKWSIGAISVGGGVSQPFIGLIDDVSVYQASLTSSEVGKLYAEKAPKYQLAEKN